MQRVNQWQIFAINCIPVIQGKSAILGLNLYKIIGVNENAGLSIYWLTFHHWQILPASLRLIWMEYISAANYEPSLKKSVLGNRLSMCYR